MDYADARQVEVEIMGRRFAIMTPVSESDTLMRAVSMLNDKIEAIRASGMVMSADKMVIMAALNLAHDLLNNPPGSGRLADEDFERRMNTLVEVCDRFRLPGVDV